MAYKPSKDEDHEVLLDVVVEKVKQDDGNGIIKDEALLNVDCCLVGRTGTQPAWISVRGGCAATLQI